MSQLAGMERHGSNPLDCVEALAESREWAVDRAAADEVNMIVAGGWGDLNLSITWREDFESLHLACSFDFKAPAATREELSRVISLINEQLYFGHFDLWRGDGTVHFRNSLILAGGAEATEAQCDVLIVTAMQSCERYFPAFQFVMWAGKTAEQAIESALLDTVGEA